MLEVVEVELDIIILMVLLVELVEQVVEEMEVHQEMVQMVQLTQEAEVVLEQEAELDHLDLVVKELLY